MATPPAQVNGSKSPDPTALVTAAIEKAEAVFREYVDVREKHLDEKIKRNQLLLDQMPEAIAKHIGQAFALANSDIGKLNELFVVHLDGIKGQFENVDKNTSSALTAAKEAVAAQDNSNQKAIAKSEDATAEKIKSMQELFSTSIGGLGTQISEVKERLDRGEGQSKGIGDMVGWIVGGVGLIATLLAIAGSIIALNN